jgi:sucrose-phosphate synthase
MATGLPGVVTRNGGPSESLVDGSRQYGVLVDPESPAAIAHGLLTVVADWERWQALGRERVLRRYTWDRTAEGYLSALADLSAPRAPVDIPGWYAQPHEALPPSLPRVFASQPEVRDDR